ncbi:HAMP domain-containing sensor histidine kinase [Thiomicrospira sp. R3]|uniref:sensor histidine kinase n=1 Tax=Thiomicrospira sp. R3 TaxID=3035472 RepID=UPI00259B821D|nr:HAMP domain-containing sensor histidine kinase [Thiomicrospira sp. R3]WFE68462.1 HAMP domain-containing sensor histidine kinase [Thiomicrospira sp. R3]
MFRHQLIISLSLLFVLILIQAWGFFWSFQKLAYHKERSLYAQQMLTDVVQFRADAKRLKVWLADFIITEKSNTSIRDNLFERMDQHLNQLTILNRLFEQSTRYEDQLFSQGVNQNTLLLTQNLSALKQALQTREVLALDSDEARWQALLALFDKFQGADMQQVINELVSLHKAQVAIAEDDAKSTRQLIYLSLVLMTLISLSLVIILSYRLIRVFNQSLNHLTYGASRFSQGKFNELIPLTGSKEFIELAFRFNEMAKRLEEHRLQQIKLQELTEDKVLERTAQLQHVVKQLSDAEKRQKGFIEELTHELRTPTTHILGEAELALRQPSEHSQNCALERIIDSCQTLASRIDDLIMVTRGQHALVSVELKPISACELYQQLIDQCLAYQVRIDFQLDIESSAVDQEKLLLVDQDKMLLVFGILLENALHYQTAPQMLQISMVQKDHTIMVRLADQGIGFEFSDSNKAFERYSRGQQAKKLRPEGLGLGLSIAKSLIDAHDGLLYFSANLPRGTKTMIELPFFDLSDESL